MKSQFMLSQTERISRTKEIEEKFSKKNTAIQIPLRSNSIK
jgi:hypothetical protein